MTLDSLLMWGMRAKIGVIFGIIIFGNGMNTDLFPILWPCVCFPNFLAQECDACGWYRSQQFCGDGINTWDLVGWQMTQCPHDFFQKDRRFYSASLSLLFRGDQDFMLLAYSSSVIFSPSVVEILLVRQIFILFVFDDVSWAVNDVWILLTCTKAFWSGFSCSPHLAPCNLGWSKIC